ncbi:MAG: GH3 auxin-responsive promoter family protein [Alistipes sp.]|jgi:hypothetical protein|nr:GH3 auxin-responsive promoter family protein [Alistipes sp.]
MLPKIIRAAMDGRLREIERFRRHPAEVQEEQLRWLVERGAATAFGQDHGLGGNGRGGFGYAEHGGGSLIERYQARVPVREYEGFAPYIERARRGERDVLWAGETRWFARSSGTTGSKSKYIPVTRDGLRMSHLRGPRDCIALNVERWPETGVYGGKTLTLGGSRRIEREGENALTGDLSAIMIENVPMLANLWRVPRTETALMADFEQKVDRICRECAEVDVRALAGVPSWNLVMLRRMLEFTGKSNLLEVWPRLELFIHGGVNFSPYREVYRRLIPSDGMHYMETYNASEGFFGIADGFGDDMLLMLDYGTFYEFLPVGDLDDPSKAVPIEGVRTGVNYAMIISSAGGLWRYMVGDTVRFTSCAPYRIRVSGRTRQYINAFGEEIIVDNAESAIAAACRETGAEVAEYTAAPVYMEVDTKGAHQWLVEFRREPSGGVGAFAEALDRALQEVNSDYEAKRWRDTTLCAPVVTALPAGTFLRWMEARGKTGGQNKVPRLANDREYVEDVLSLMNRELVVSD